MAFRRIFLFFLSFLILLKGYSNSIDITDNQEIIDFDKTKVEYFVDPSNELSGNDVQRLMTNCSSLSNRYSTWKNANVWLRIKVYNKNSKHSKWVLEFKDPHISKIELYKESYHSLVKVGNQSGFSIPFGERFYKHKNHVFDLIIPKGETNVYYIKYYSAHTSSFNFLIRTNRDFTNYAINEYFLLGLFYGFLLLMFLYNIVLYLVVKEKSYLLYALYVIATALYSFTEDGLGFQYIWGDYPVFNILDKNFSPLVICVFYFLFIQNQLDLKKHAASVNKVMLYYLFVFAVVMTGLSIFQYDSILIRLLPLSVFALIFGITFYLSFGKNLATKLLSLGTGIMLLSYFVFVLRQFKVLNGNIFTVYVFDYGFIIELFVLSLANGARLRSIAQETKKAQLETINLLKEKNKFERNYNQNLAKDVLARTLEIEQKNIEIKSFHQNLVESINYSKLIQSSLLQDSEIILKNYFDSFVFFKPKDTISGDFYWCNEDGRRFILAVADCTGHGVPGALTGMVCFSTLNSIVNEMKIEEPSMIVKELNRKIYHTLNQNSVEQGEKHGVDIAIVNIDVERRQVTFCGANRPFYLIRNGLLLEKKGNRINIGDEFVLSQRLSQETIYLQEGDLMYLFSDGYVDQFGGDEDKKFLSSQFKSLLLEVSRLEMNAQHQVIEQRFQEWKGDSMQIDDVLVVGVKF